MNYSDEKAERREQKLKARKGRMPVSGRTLGVLYETAVTNRLDKINKKRKKHDSRHR